MLARILFPAFIALAAAAYGYVALSYPGLPLRRGFGAGFFPTLIAGFILALAVIETIIQVLVYRRARRTAVPGEDRETPAVDGVPPGDGVMLDELWYTTILIVSVVVAVLAIRPVGFIPASTALIAFLAATMGVRPLWHALLGGLITSGGIYLVFAKAFGVVLAF